MLLQLLGHLSAFVESMVYGRVAQPKTQIVIGIVIHPLLRVCDHLRALLATAARTRPVYRPRPSAYDAEEALRPAVPDGVRQNVCVIYGARSRRA